MKKLLFLVVIIFSVTTLWSQSDKAKSQEDRNFRMPLIGETAPSFTANSTNGTINFPGDFGANWKILFSHPQDFTPVCSSELLELASRQKEFEKLGIKVAVLSADELSTHVQWKKSLESINSNGNVPTKIMFPLIEDKNISISKAYGMIHPESNSTKSVRGVFIIDPQNKIQSISFYPMAVGRSSDEILRLVSALQETASAKVLTPVDWEKGDDLLLPYAPPKGSVDPEFVPEGYYYLAWYMWYKKVE